MTDLDRLGNRETPTVLSLLVVEDLAMAIYLPVMAIVLARAAPTKPRSRSSIAVPCSRSFLYLALRHGAVLSRLVAARSNEGLLLSVLGLTLLVAGLAQRVNISAAVGAFLVGIALSGRCRSGPRQLIEPLRDLFAAMFFLFFGLQIDPTKLVDALPVALALVVVTGATKVVTGGMGHASQRHRRRGQIRAGTVLIARGEFSIVIAGLAASAGADPELASLAAAYVLVSATIGPIITRVTDRSPRKAPGVHRRATARVVRSNTPAASMSVNTCSARCSESVCSPDHAADPDGGRV